MDLVEILKKVPTGTKLYSTVYGEMELYAIKEDDKKYPIQTIVLPDRVTIRFTKDGEFNFGSNGECVLFPSKTNRDWEAFAKSLEPECPFKPYDRVLVRDRDKNPWVHEIFGMYVKDSTYPYICLCCNYRQCIPFEGNEHLLGTTNNPTE